ncbi:hypothetical protein EI94DRAFT_1569782, partial [Lactarius quietus]
LWVMWYCRGMGYGSKIPASELEKSKILWDMRGYGLQGVWIRREATVVVSSVYSIFLIQDSRSHLLRPQASGSTPGIASQINIRPLSYLMPQTISFEGSLCGLPCLRSLVS